MIMFMVIWLCAAALLVVGAYCEVPIHRAIDCVGIWLKARFTKH